MFPESSGAGRPPGHHWSPDELAVCGWTEVASASASPALHDRGFVWYWWANRHGRKLAVPKGPRRLSGATRLRIRNQVTKHKRRGGGVGQRQSKQPGGRRGTAPHHQRKKKKKRGGGWGRVGGGGPKHQQKKKKKKKKKNHKKKKIGGRELFVVRFLQQLCYIVPAKGGGGGGRKNLRSYLACSRACLAPQKGGVSKPATDSTRWGGCQHTPHGRGGA